MSKVIELHSGKPVEIIYVEEPRSIGVELLGTIISNIIKLSNKVILYIHLLKSSISVMLVFSG